MAAAKATFRDEIGDVAYESLLPPGQTPDPAINRAIMETFRPAMRAHYLNERPRFA